jgi:hypothetical protein
MSGKTRTGRNTYNCLGGGEALKSDKADYFARVSPKRDWLRTFALRLLHPPESQFQSGETLRSLLFPSNHMYTF